MKMKKLLLCICLIPLLASCDSPGADGKTHKKSGEATTTLPDAYAYNPKDASMATGYVGNFKLQEYKDMTFEVANEQGGATQLRIQGYDETGSTKLITDKLYQRDVFARDVNEDGYRELIYFVKSDKGRSFNVFDVFNNKLLFQEEQVKDLNKFYSYYGYNIDFRDNRVTFLPYFGNFSENSIMDTGYLNYNNERGYFFTWNNKNGFKSLELVKWYTAPSKGTYHKEDCSELAPTSTANNKPKYTFSLTGKYVMEVKLSFLDPNKECNFSSRVISFYREDTNKVYWKTFNDMSLINPTEDSKRGIFRYEIEMIEEFEDRTWEFFLFDKSFSMSAKVVE